MRRIKRSHYSIYTSRRRSTAKAVKAVVGVVAVAALVFLGYSIASPLYNLATGKWKPPVASSSSKKAVSSSSKASSKASSSSPKAKVMAAKVRGVYLPKSYLSDTAALNTFITQAKAAGINLAIIDLKAEDGVVNYASKVQEIQGTDALPSGEPDASAAAKALSAAGITPAARICAFEDPIAPSVMRGSGVLYSGNHSINWLDPTNKRWLNPYSTVAQQYITNLSTEAVSLGYKEVFVDSLTFPTKGNPDSQGYYGDNLPSKEQCISSFTASLKQAVNAAGGKLSVIMPGTAAVGKAPANLGQSQDIFTLSGDFITPNICPSLFDPAGIQIGANTIQKPDLTPGDTVNAIAQYLKTQDGAKLSTAVPIIQDFTNTGIGDGNYKQYTAADVKAEITALTGAGIDSYILYNPQGTYDFSWIQ